jgi:quercetin dioxygenase-like cupin family protein
MDSTVSRADGVVVQTADHRTRFEVLGTDIQLLAGKDRTGGAIEAVESRFPPGKGVPLHYHKASSESVYVLDGEMTILSREDPVTAPTGAFVYLPEGVAHGFENRTQADVRVLIVWSPQLGPGAETVFTRLASLSPGPPEMSTVGPMLEAMDMHPAMPPAG